MPWSWKRDPVTGDLIPDGAGGFEKTETAEVLVQNELLVHIETNWCAPGRGSTLHDLDLFKQDPIGLVPEEARRALRNVELAGRIANIEVAAELPKPGRIHVATRFRDTSANQLVDTFVPVAR
jgi:hypothetical protein